MELGFLYRKVTFLIRKVDYAYEKPIMLNGGGGIPTKKVGISVVPASLPTEFSPFAGGKVNPPISNC